MKNWDLSIKCQFCGNLFKDRRGLTGHLRNKHPEFTHLQAKERYSINKRNTLYK